MARTDGNSPVDVAAFVDEDDDASATRNAATPRLLTRDSSLPPPSPLSWLPFLFSFANRSR